MRPQLPVPSADALQASEALKQHIMQEIHHHHGWISFAHYMDLVLYTPTLGYYSGGSTKLGQSGDFTTAPEISSLFGTTLAQIAAHVMQQTVPVMTEFGAGTGKLAFDLLTELKQLGQLPQTYYIVEVSGQLRAQQQKMLQDFPMVVWLDQLPSALSGCVIGNEVLDAMPARLVIKTEHGWAERGVGVKDGQLFYHNHAMHQHDVAQIPDADSLPIGYETEIHERAAQFMQTIGDLIQQGLGAAALWIDYGFPAHEYYCEDRSMGTLMCHYRHYAHSDPFYLPGLQDITAHVDFTHMASMAVSAGADVLWYATQAAFLFGSGIGDILLRTSPEDALSYLPQARAVQKLTSPAEMGELFKVLMIGKHVVLPESIMHFDRSHRL